MQHLHLMTLLAGSAAIAGCAAAPPPPRSRSRPARFAPPDRSTPTAMAPSPLPSGTPGEPAASASGTPTRTTGSTAANSRPATGPAASIQLHITTPTIGPITGPRSTPMATASSAPMNIGRPRPGRASIAIATESSIRTNGCGGRCSLSPPPSRACVRGYVRAGWRWAEQSARSSGGGKARLPALSSRVSGPSKIGQAFGHRTAG